MRREGDFSVGFSGGVSEVEVASSVVTGGDWTGLVAVEKVISTRRVWRSSASESIQTGRMGTSSTLAGPE